MLRRDDLLLKAFAMVDLRQYTTKASKTNIKRHLDAWRHCKKCGLCRERANVALFRGHVPCDILFIGDNPGDAEDTLAKPLLGNDGSMLDSLIKRSEANSGVKPKIAFTTLVSCVPFQSIAFSDVRKPTRDEVDACSERLREFIHIAKPRCLVTVGPTAKTMLPKDITVRERRGERIPLLFDIKHPWQMRKMANAMATLEQKRIVMKLSRVFKQVAK